MNVSTGRVITSHSNHKLKQVRALRLRKHRVESGQFLVEGIHPIGEAVAASLTLFPTGIRTIIEGIYYAPDLLTSEFAVNLINEQNNRGIACYPVSEDVFSTLTEKENPQGILAVVRQNSVTLEHLTPDNFTWGVALLAPQDPGNVGTILRTIDAVGASGLLLLDSSVDPHHPSVVRASMGTLFWYPVVTTSFEDFSGWVRRKGYKIYGTSAHGNRDYLTIDSYEHPFVLLMGSEREGLTPEQVTVCQELIRLPMGGRSSSLNLAIATGVMLYAILENRARKTPD